MSLRDALKAAWQSRPFVLIPERLQQAHRELEAFWIQTESRQPPPFELGDIVERVRDTWRQDGSLTRLARSDRQWLPYALFYPVNESGAWLAADLRFAESFLAECHQTPRLVPVTVRQLLLRFPTSLATFTQLRDGLRQALHHVNHPGIERWRVRVGEFGLLSPNGPSTFARSLFDPDETPEAVYERAGVDEELRAGEFVRLAFREGLSALEQQLAKGSAPTAIHYGLGVLASAGRLQFPQDAHVVAHALLRPHIRRKPEEQLRVQLQKFLLQHLHDPRFDRAHWQRVEPQSVAVLKRWMLGATLDAFFRLISKNALATHWKYRQAFWGAYFKKGLIGDAWVVLGEDSRRLARALWSDAPSYASLEGSGDPTHSVLLLQVGSLSIAEWSHNGRCRVWRDGSKTAPKFYLQRYSSWDLRSTSDFELTHTASESYSWQGRLADFIRRETQCDVRREEYRA